jgi:formylglycine-generating enzyme required for sulfatase activity
MPPRPLLAALACAGWGILLAGCPLSIDEGLLARDASVADVTSESDGPARSEAGDGPDAGSGGCPPAMIQVPSPSAGPWFCVDATEVTSKAYRAFIAAADPPEAGAQRPECNWNTSYSNGVALESDERPVHAVDWCDAVAFCKWAGKRLCGAIGGGPASFDGYPGSPSTGQWYNACSRWGQNAFPYGSPYQPTWCNGAPLDAGGPVPVASLPHCEGGYPGLFDMSGNVSEFLDSCSTTADSSCGTGVDCDLCLLVGGGFLSGATDGGNIACGYANEVYRKSQYDDNGLRCCADLP